MTYYILFHYTHLNLETVRCYPRTSDCGQINFHTLNQLFRKL